MLCENFTYKMIYSPIDIVVMNVFVDFRQTFV